MWIFFGFLIWFDRLFAVVDDIFCIFRGHIENLPFLRQQYGLSKVTNEAIMVIEAYRTLRDRGPYPVDKVVRDFHGNFAFILFDGTNKTVFAAAVTTLFFIWVFFWLLLRMDLIVCPCAGCWWYCALLLGNWCWRSPCSLWWHSHCEERLLQILQSFP